MRIYATTWAVGSRPPKGKLAGWVESTYWSWTVLCLEEEEEEEEEEEAKVTVISLLL